MGQKLIPADENFGAIAVCAVRYGLWRRTYITSLTARYLAPLVAKECFSQKTLNSMHDDLCRYETERSYRVSRLANGDERWKNTLDDECDYQAWKMLHKEILRKDRRILMKVTSSEEDKLTFDNGVSIMGFHYADCCENNYLDFSQIVVGDEFPTKSAIDLLASLVLKEDGFIIKDISGTPKWVQARSEQNGYYSPTVGLRIQDEQCLVEVWDKKNQELFEGAAE